MHATVRQKLNRNIPFGQHAVFEHLLSALWAGLASSNQSHLSENRTTPGQFARWGAYYMLKHQPPPCNSEADTMNGWSAIPCGLIASCCRRFARIIKGDFMILPNWL